MFHLITLHTNPSSETANCNPHTLGVSVAAGAYDTPEEPIC